MRLGGKNNMSIPKRYFAEFSQSVPPTTQLSASSVYTASYFKFEEEILTVPITGTINAFTLSPLTGVYLITKAWIVNPYTTAQGITASVSVRKTSDASVVAQSFTGILAPGNGIHTMSLAANAREVVAFGGTVYHFSSSLVTGSLPLMGQIAYKKAV